MKDGNSVFEDLVQGFEEIDQWQKGKRKLRTTKYSLPDAPPALSCAEIVHLRRELKMSQGYFSRLLGVSAKTVQGWEQGIRSPSSSALRLLQIIRTKPEVVDLLVSDSKK